MADEERFSNREIRLMLQSIDDKLSGFIANYDKRITDLEKDVKEFSVFQVRAMTLWGVFVTALSFAVTKLL